MSPGHQLPITENDLIQFEKDPKYYEQSQAFQRLLMEKEQTLATLRNETLMNEEQRNYIEILKQTIETSIIKNGLGPVLQKSQNSSQGQSNLDIIIDFTKLKRENEKIRKDLIMEQVVLTDMKSELESYKKQAEDLDIINKQLRGSLHKETNEKNEAYKRLNQLDKNKGNLLNEIDLAIKENKMLKINFSEYQSQNKQLEKEILENKRDINTLTITLNELSPFKSKYNGLSKQFHELQLKYTETTKYNKDLERSNEKLKMNLDIQLSNTKKLTQLIEENSQNYQEEKQNLIHEQNTLMNVIKQSENEQMEISNDLLQKDNEIKQLKEKEKDLYQTHSTLTDTKNVLNEYKITTENQIKALFKSSREAQIEADQLKYLNNNLQIEVNAKEKELMIMKNDILKAQSEIKVLKKDNTAKASSIQELSSQLNKKISENEIKEEETNQIQHQYSSLEKETTFWKDKYDQDIYLKTQEVNSLRRDIDDLNFKIEDINKSYSKIVNENSLKNEEIVKADEREKNRLNEFKMLKDNNNELNKMLEKNLLNLKAELKKGFELNNANSIQTIQIRDLQTSADQLKENNNKKEELIKSQSNELIKLKAQNKKNEIKQYSLTTTFAAIAKMIMSSYNIIQEFVAKFKEIIEDNKSFKFNMNPLSNYYSISFHEFVNENGSNCKNETDYMRNIEKFISVVITEIEILYEHIKSVSDNDEMEKKMVSLEQSLNLGETEIKQDKSRLTIDNKLNHEGKTITNNTIHISENTITNPNILSDNMPPGYDTDSNEKIIELYKEKEQYSDYNQKIKDIQKYTNNDKENEEDNIMQVSSISGMKKQIDISECISHQNTIPMNNYIINSNYQQYNHNDNSHDNIKANNNNIHAKTYELMSNYNTGHQSFQLHDTQPYQFLRQHQINDSVKTKNVNNNKNYSFGNSSLYPH